MTVAYGTDIDRAIEVVDDVGREMAGDPAWKRRVLEAPRVERVAALAEYGVTLKILGTVRAADQWAAAGEFRKRLLAAFKTNGIEIPRPQRVVLARDPADDLNVGLAPDRPVGPAPDQDDLAEGDGVGSDVELPSTELAATLRGAVGWPCASRHATRGTP